MEGTQAEVRTATSATDDELINLLVPPRRPRWQTALVVCAIAVVLVGIVLVSESGAVTPRIETEISQYDAGTPGGDHVLTVVFRLHNVGWTSAQVRGVDASQPELHGMHVQSRLPHTLGPDKSVEIRIRFDRYDCESGTSNSDRAREIRVRVKNVFGVTITHAVKVVLHNGANDTGWPSVATSFACADG